MQAIMKRSKLIKGKCKMFSLRRKGIQGNSMDLSLILRDIKSFKSLTLNGIKKVETSGQDSTQVSFQLVKRI